MATPVTPANETGGLPRPAGSRAAILTVIAVAQLLVVLDNTVMNIALPSVQTDLGFGAADRQWIVSAYALAFGSLLLLGGRLSAMLGHRRAFVIGLGGFAVASAVGGLGTGLGLLVAARAGQGVFGALLAPAALSLLTATFSDARGRAVALGVFAAIVGSGGTAGLLLGGFLTQYLSWHWCQFAGAVVAVGSALGALGLLPRDADRAHVRIDLPGAATVSTGLFCLVLGLGFAGTRGWSSPIVVGLLIGGLVLLLTFVVVERHASAPLLPLRIVLDRDRGGGFLATFLGRVLQGV